VSDWEPPQPPGSGPDEYLARLVVVSTPDGLTSRWEGGEPPAEVRAEVSAFARRMSADDVTLPARPDPVFLRLKVRDATVASPASGREHAIDFEFGPMGAPPDIPRVPVDALFRYAAEHA
jgi:hypothetical protein